MKTIIYSLLFLLFAATSCRKKDKGSDEKKCNYALFALKSTRTGYYKIVTVDTATGKSTDNLPFPEIHGEGYLSQADKSYYVMQTDTAGWLKFFKFNLEDKTTTVYAGPQIASGSSFTEAYSSYDKRFYILEIHDSWLFPYEPVWTFNVVKFTDDNFTLEPVNLSTPPPKIFPPMLSNLTSGDIYVYVYNVPLRSFFRFVPSQSEMIKTDIPTNFDGMVFNKNDGLIYGYFPGGSYWFVRANPENGMVDTISQISLSPGYSFCTFDDCKNQFIFENQGSDGNVRIYWLDVNNGSIRKQLNANDDYTHIMCLNLN